MIWTARKRIIEYKWSCPYCSEVGRKWLTSCNARKCGRFHMEKIHDKKGTPDIIKRRIKVEDSMDK